MEERLFILIDIRKSPILSSEQHPIDKVGSTTAFSSEDAFPSAYLLKSWNFSLMIVIVKRIQIMLMSQDEW